jgi:hypothetical protein
MYYMEEKQSVMYYKIKREQVIATYSKLELAHRILNFVREYLAFKK